MTVHYGYRPALDGVRTLAVYLVLLFHTGMASMSGGFVGVDVFFVLSGFLVTQVLLSEADHSGTIDVGRFYARRVRRLLPAAVVVVVATCAVWTLLLSVVRRLPLVGDAQSALLYVANWRFLAQQQDYFASEVDRSPFLHFWSLAIEEQFYLLYPALLLLLLRAARGRRTVLPLTLAGFLVASVAAQLFWHVHDPDRAYLGTDARLYQLFAGALAAVLLRRGAGPSRWGGLGGWIGFLGVGLVGSGLLDMDATWRGLAVTVAAVLLVNAVATWDAHPLTRLFSLAPIAYLGRISYGTYLWHWPVLLFLQEVLRVRPLWLAVIGAAVSTGLAAVSYELVEMPVRRARRLQPLTWPVALSGVTASALLAVLVVPPVLQSGRTPAIQAQDEMGLVAAATDRRVPTGVDWERWARDTGKAHDCPTPEECLVVDGDGPHVVLVGDSHAVFLQAALEELARERGFRLSVNTRLSCPWQAEVVDLSVTEEKQAACDHERSDWYRDVFPQLDADVLVLVSNMYDRYHRDHLQRVGGSDETTAELLLDTTNDTLDLITEAGADALVLQNTIRPRPLDPLECLSRSTHERACTVPVPIERPRSDSYYQAADVASPSVFTFDINPVICPDAPLCRPMLRGAVVWRDVSHLGSTVLVRLRDEIWREIVDSGVMERHGLS